MIDGTPWSAEGILQPHVLGMRKVPYVVQAAMTAKDRKSIGECLPRTGNAYWNLDTMNCCIAVGRA